MPRLCLPDGHHMKPKRPRPKLIVTSVGKPDPKIAAEYFAPLLLDWWRREREGKCSVSRPVDAGMIAADTSPVAEKKATRV